MGKTTLTLGIGITTYNRADLLTRTLDAVQRHTLTRHVLFVANDGSADDTAERLAAREGLVHVNGSNRGIACNKNRALYYLHALRHCDVVILLEDDTFPTSNGWEWPWIEGAIRYGHVNLAPSHWNEDFIRGDGSVANPFVSSVLTGQCASFSAAALDQVGYMDTRFRQYGLEHVEHTFRMIGAGYGGVSDEHGAPTRPFLIRSALTVTELTKGPDMEGVRHNEPIFAALRQEPLYRHAWRTDEELAILRAEMQPFQFAGSAATRSVPWYIGAFDQHPLVLTEHNLIETAVTTAIGRILLSVTGASARLAVEFADRSRRWLEEASDNRFVPTNDYGAATVYEFVSARDVGFGLRRNGAYLCRDLGVGGRVTIGRLEMAEWETFRFLGFALSH